MKFRFSAAVQQQEFQKEVQKAKKYFASDETNSHLSSPFIYEGCSPDLPSSFIGGTEELVSLLKNRHGVSPGECYF